LNDDNREDRQIIRGLRKVRPKLKKIQIIAAENCSRSVCAIPEDEFVLLFPNGQDIEFLEEAFIDTALNPITPFLRNPGCEFSFSSSAPRIADAESNSVCTGRIFRKNWALVWLCCRAHSV
jgi:hypothetical protein